MITMIMTKKKNDDKNNDNNNKNNIIRCKLMKKSISGFGIEEAQKKLSLIFIIYK